MKGPAVRYEVDDGVAFVTLNRPDQLNAVNNELLSDLCASLSRAGDAEVGAVVLSGAGRAFCAGHDLKQEPEKVADEGALRRIGQLAEITRTIRRLSVPVIAAVHGYALGAGCEFALCCDLVAAETGTVFGFPEVEVGLAVTGGISYLLPLAVGPVKAKELLLLGSRIDADEAARLRLVNAVVPDARSQAVEWARSMSSKPRLAAAFAKSCLDTSPLGDIDTAFGLESSASLALLNSPDAKAAAERFQQRSRAVNDGH